MRYFLPICFRTIVILWLYSNPSTTNEVWFAVGVAGDTLDPTVAANVCAIIPPRGSFTVGMGPASMRPQSIPTGEDQLVYQTNAGAVTVNINYICSNEL